VGRNRPVRRSSSVSRRSKGRRLSNGTPDAKASSRYTVQSPAANVPAVTEPAHPVPAAAIVARPSPAEPRRRSRVPYVRGLDGLRALAVIAVVLYHSGWRWAVGGYLGVEVFFVISGYLITTTLYSEWRSEGRVSLGRFWLSRARRLLPALAVLLLGALAYAVLMMPQEVARLRADALAAMAYASNWYMVLVRQSYFETVGRPSLLRHLWSLAVEEQYYLVWPIAFALLMRLGRQRLTLGVTLLAAAGSSILMAMLYWPGTDPSRVYYGTDTRAAGLLIGSALALLLVPAASQGGARPRRSLALDAGAGAALLALIACLSLLDSEVVYLYQGGFAAVSLLTAAVIAGAAHARAWLLPTILGWRPLRWLASRSYGIYLWHWPVFVATRPYVDVPLAGVPLLALRLGVTVLCAELSYRLVEMPVRSGALARSWRRMTACRGWRGFGVRLTWAGAAATASLCLAMLGASVGSAEPPAPPPYLRLEQIDTLSLSSRQRPAASMALAATPDSPPVEAPVADATAGAPMEEQSPGAALTATLVADLPQPTPPEAAIATQAVPLVGEAHAQPDAPVDVEVPVSLSPLPLPTEEATPTPEPVPAEAVAAAVSAIGDSVMLGAADALTEEIPDVGIDAALSRQARAIIEVLTERLDAGELGQKVVVHIGNNGNFSSKQFDEVMTVLGSERRVVFVNAKVPREWEGTNNTTIAEGVERYANAVLADWHEASIDHPEYFWDDGIHLRPDGARAYALLIASALETDPAAAGPAE
jgi:peptidoglycan/LPS O-acetylase OafA/YrhL